MDSSQVNIPPSLKQPEKADHNLISGIQVSLGESVWYLYHMFDNQHGVMENIVDQGQCDLGSGLGLSLIASMTLGKSLNYSSPLSANLKMMGLNQVLLKVPSSSNMIFNFLDEVMVVLGWEYRKPMNGQDVVENPRKFLTIFLTQCTFLLNVPTFQLLSYTKYCNLFIQEVLPLTKYQPQWLLQKQLFKVKQ